MYFVQISLLLTYQVFMYLIIFILTILLVSRAEILKVRHASRSYPAEYILFFFQIYQFLLLAIFVVLQLNLFFV